MTRGADCILQFIEQGKMQEAIALMNDPHWGIEHPISSHVRACHDLHLSLHPNTVILE
jgi:hypothetical protein